MGLQILSALLAAAIHDLQHPGTTNAYHVMQSNPLAMRFNDQHVLENHSLVLSLGLLRRPGFDFLENMTEFQKRKVRIGHNLPLQATYGVRRNCSSCNRCTDAYISLLSEQMLD